MCGPALDAAGDKPTRLKLLREALSQAGLPAASRCTWHTPNGAGQGVLYVLFDSEDDAATCLEAFLGLQIGGQPCGAHRPSGWRAAAGGGRAGARQRGGVNFKSKLTELATKRARGSRIKGNIAFKAWEDVSGAGWWAIVRFRGVLMQEHWSAAPEWGKKKAKQEAAKAALYAEFPEAMAEVSNGPDPSDAQDPAGAPREVMQAQHRELQSR